MGWGRKKSRRSTSPRKGSKSSLNLDDTVDANINYQIGIQLVKRATRLESEQSYEQARNVLVEAITKLTDYAATLSPANVRLAMIHNQIDELKAHATALAELHNLPDVETPLGAAEYIVRYVGTFPLTTTRWQAWTSRTDMLEALDQARRDGHVRWTNDAAVPCVLTLSMYGMKLTGEHDEVQVKHTLHEVAAVNACEDDGVWLVFFKTGTPGVPETYGCHVCECPTERDTIELAKLVRENVEAAYTKVGLPFSKSYEEPSNVVQDTQSDDASAFGLSSVAPDVVVTDEPRAGMALPGRETPPERAKARIRLASQPLSETSDVSDAHEHVDVVEEAFPKPNGPVNTTEMVAAYMSELREVLTQNEIREFAAVLRALRFKSLRLDKFCSKLQTLFGDDRMYMLPGMRSFVGDSQVPAFDKWIDENVPATKRGRPQPSSKQNTEKRHLADVVLETQDVMKKAKALGMVRPTAHSDDGASDKDSDAHSMAGQYVEPVDALNRAVALGATVTSHGASSPPPPGRPPAPPRSPSLLQDDDDHGDDGAPTVPPPLPPTQDVDGDGPTSPPPPVPPPLPPQDTGSEDNAAAKKPGYNPAIHGKVAALFQKAATEEQNEIGHHKVFVQRKMADAWIDKVKNKNPEFGSDKDDKEERPALDKTPARGIWDREANASVVGNRAEMFRNLSTKTQSSPFGVVGTGDALDQKAREAEKDAIYPPKIDLYAGVRSPEEEAELMKPAWDSSAAPQVPAIRPDQTSFHKPVPATKEYKSAAQIARERIEAKRAAEEADRKAREEAERLKYAHLPAWRRRMLEEKEAKEKEAAKPKMALEQRRIEVENMFNDLPPWQRERAIKKEKKRIEMEEGIVL